MALTTIPSELSSVSGISDSSTSTAITINSSQEVTFAGNITTGSNTISGVLSSVTGSIGSAATATTQAASDNSTKLATTAYVTTALANLVDSAPGTLNTLNELAAALGDDANFSTTVTNSIATKLPLAGGTMTGDVVVNDSVKFKFGTGSDLQIFHDGNNSFINNTSGTAGALSIKSHDIILMTSSSETMAAFVEDGAVTLYHNNSAKLATASDGADVTGTFDASGTILASAAAAVNSTSKGGFGYASNVTQFYSFGADASTAGGYTFQNLSNNASINITAMTIEANGRVLVGKTSTGLGNAGVEFESGQIKGTSANQVVQYLNRTSSDGTILEFRKDNSSIGHIGTTGGKLYIGSPDGSDAFLRFESNEISPSAHDGSFRDAVISLGKSSSRFNNLYLSGLLNGMSTVKSVSGNRWGISPEVEGNGVMEIGRYLDFHTTDGDTSDYGIRLDYDGSNLQITNSIAVAGQGDFSTQILVGTNNTHLSENNLRFQAPGHAYIDQNYLGHDFIFRTGVSSALDTTALRLQNNGAVFMGGTTDSTLYNNTSGGGLAFMDSNRLDVARAGDVVATFNRMTNDGQVIQIYGAGTLHGGISAKSGDLVIHSTTTDHVGLSFGNTRIEPTNNYGTTSDNTVDLGNTDRRFKDLYLSGGVYLGGVGAANHFSDYEEGTWAPYISTDGGAQPSGQTYTVRGGHYVKIGNWVMYTFDVGISTYSSASSQPNTGTYVTLGGFPFAGKSGASNATGGLVVGYYTGFSINHPLGGYLNGTTQYLMEQGTSGTDYVTVADNKVSTAPRMIGYVLQLTNS